jgi:superfamily II DNA/RNA helicase
MDTKPPSAMTGSGFFSTHQPPDWPAAPATGSGRYPLRPGRARLTHDFDELNLAPAILEAVREQGYDTPTPIQAEAIPAVLAGHDLLAGAQTGTGKTAAFTLPMLQRLQAAEAPRTAAARPVRALVLTPTRELAAQVEESVRPTANTSR